MLTIRGRGGTAAERETRRDFDDFISIRSASRAIFREGFPSLSLLNMGPQRETRNGSSPCSKLRRLARESSAREEKTRGKTCALPISGSRREAKLAVNVCPRDANLL